MVSLLVAVHVLVCFIMIGVVLLQAGKGAEIGAAFGGSSQTIFGSRGPANFLSKMTVAAAVIFMLSSLALSVISGGSSIASKINLPPAEDLPFGEFPVTEEPPPILPEGDVPGEAPAVPSASEIPPLAAESENP